MNALRLLFTVTLMSALGLTGCSTSSRNTAASAPKPVLEVRWQRLVDEKGQTCARCGSTEKTTEAAVRKLRRSLKPLDIDVALQKTSLSQADFSRNPMESNRIWIGGRPIEDWLQAKVGQSQCGGACGDSECRTLTVDGKVYEAVSAELILRAGLLAAAQSSTSQPPNPWNPTASWSAEPSACCPPSPGQRR